MVAEILFASQTIFRDNFGLLFAAMISSFLVKLLTNFGARPAIWKGPRTEAWVAAELAPNKA